MKNDKLTTITNIVSTLERRHSILEREFEVLSKKSDTVSDFKVINFNDITKQISLKNAYYDSRDKSFTSNICTDAYNAFEILGKSFKLKAQYIAYMDYHRKSKKEKIIYHFNRQIIEKQSFFNDFRLYNETEKLAYFLLLADLLFKNKNKKAPTSTNETANSSTDEAADIEKLIDEEFTIENHKSKNQNMKEDFDINEMIGSFMNERAS